MHSNSTAEEDSYSPTSTSSSYPSPSPTQLPYGRYHSQPLQRPLSSHAYQQSDQQQPPTYPSYGSLHPDASSDPRLYQPTTFQQQDPYPLPPRTGQLSCPPEPSPGTNDRSQSREGHVPGNSSYDSSLTLAYPPSPNASYRSPLPHPISTNRPSSYPSASSFDYTPDETPRPPPFQQQQHPSFDGVTISPRAFSPIAGSSYQFPTSAYSHPPPPSRSRYPAYQNLSSIQDDRPRSSSNAPLDSYASSCSPSKDEGRERSTSGKGEQAKDACSACHQMRKLCDSGRPCGRCVQRGSAYEESCRDSGRDSTSDRSTLSSYDISQLEPASIASTSSSASFLVPSVPSLHAFSAAHASYPAPPPKPSFEPPSSSTEFSPSSAQTQPSPPLAIHPAASHVLASRPVPTRTVSGSRISNSSTRAYPPRAPSLQSEPPLMSVPSTIAISRAHEAWPVKRARTSEQLDGREDDEEEVQSQGNALRTMSGTKQTPYAEERETRNEPRGGSSEGGSRGLKRRRSSIRMDDHLSSQRPPYPPSHQSAQSQPYQPYQPYKAPTAIPARLSPFPSNSRPNTQSRLRRSTSSSSYSQPLHDQLSPQPSPTATTSPLFPSRGPSHAAQQPRRPSSSGITPADRRVSGSYPPRQSMYDLGQQPTVRYVRPRSTSTAPPPLGPRASPLPRQHDEVYPHEASRRPFQPERRPEPDRSQQPQQRNHQPVLPLAPPPLPQSRSSSTSASSSSASSKSSGPRRIPPMLHLKLSDQSNHVQNLPLRPQSPSQYPHGSSPRSVPYPPPPSSSSNVSAPNRKRHPSTLSASELMPPPPPPLPRQNYAPRPPHPTFLGQQSQTRAPPPPSPPLQQHYPIRIFRPPPPITTISYPLWLEDQEKGRVARDEVPESPKRLEFGVDLEGWMGRLTTVEGGEVPGAEAVDVSADAAGMVAAEAEWEGAITTTHLIGDGNRGEYVPVSGATSPLTDLGTDPPSPAPPITSPTSHPKLETYQQPAFVSSSPSSHARVNDSLESPAWSPAGSPTNSVDSN